MKKLFPCVVLLLAVASGEAQNVSDRPAPEFSVAETINSSPAFDFSRNAMNMVTEMCALIGLKPNFTVREANVKNARARIRRGQRVIEYSPEFMRQIHEKKLNAWTYVFILAHEIGHHLNGHTVQRNRKSNRVELDADEFAGFMLRKMGATLLQSRMAVRHISNPLETKSHPGTTERVDAVEKGWLKAASSAN
ncbi:MAG TPA: hypothetical protein VEB63_02045 [Chitinophagaceae bacterium]|nr:hypothetical protein [Chitinophagaceae bacterium]